MVRKFSVQQVKPSTILLTFVYHSMFPLDRILTTSNGYIYSYILDNTRTVRRQYAMFGIRELSASELAAYCANNGSVSNSTTPITDRTANFTANYQIRTYTSGCFYLDRNLYWRSLGVTVSWRREKDE